LPRHLHAVVLLQLPVPGSVASLQMSPQGVVRSFYPLKGNEAALNHNLFRGRLLLMLLQRLTLLSLSDKISQQQLQQLR
jgi:hypothetical protein